ncbi:FAD-dependent oxidoreductase [Nocardia speluncae]|uniref:FAD-dependent oxidoreductase n=1 Tax=Nocardia speluncae TaxID=419477 RepID=A0A846XM58_9NOCA|nr:FAD-dependent monooxygenase [Nocardia speluncae]NKY35680.1 FAD-dependent oxidoreductase [Nocardia speluncae]
MSVLIAGAGPTGMVAALVLAANGVECRVLERRAQPSGSSRALGLQARSMELLAGMGVAEDIERVAYRLSGASMMRGDTELSRFTWVPPQSPYPYTYVLPQSGLEDILRDRLRAAGVEIETGAQVQTVTQGENTVEVTLADGREISAEWLIGADGSRSRVREELGIELAGRETGETYYLADIVLDQRPPFQDSAMWLGPAGPFMLMRLPGADELWRIFADMTDTRPLAERPGPGTAELQALLGERGPSRTRITEVQWTSIYRTRVGLAARYRRGRVFLAGDAAHVFPPFGGQGMNLGIQDAVGLAWRLARVEHGAPVDLLAAYETERRPVAAAIIRDVESRRRLYALRNPVARALRDALLRYGSRVPGAARQASRQNSQLDIGYGRGRGWPRAQGPRIGDRAPDAPLAGGTVYDRLGVDHFTLLVFGAADVTETGNEGGGAPYSVSGAVEVRIDDETDPTGAAGERYGLRRGGYVLIRPDGYVAYRGSDGAEARRVAAAFTGAGQPV